MDTSKNATLRALRLLLRPIARILLRTGVIWKEFAEISKATFVEVASEDFGIRGRPTNISRVAILTGFTRREVRRLREVLDRENPESFERMNYATRVLTGWFTDPEFIDEKGHPRVLAANGTNPSFESLCRKYSGDVAATTLLKELRHVGAVAETDGGRLVAKTRYYMPALTDPGQVLRSGGVLEDIGSTVAYNLHRQPEDPSRFERRATNVSMPATAVPAFREWLEHEGQAFLERADAWLTQHENRGTGDEETVRLGVGAYWIESSNTEE
ncbi:MAG: DUF6502 family protein [Woeseiaceae bacterium]|nr:DUF6502 family protein [Woeseiaceae bacterium]